MWIRFWANGAASVITLALFLVMVWVYLHLRKSKWWISLSAEKKDITRPVRVFSESERIQRDLEPSLRIAFLTGRTGAGKDWLDEVVEFHLAGGGVEVWVSAYSQTHQIEVSFHILLLVEPTPIMFSQNVAADGDMICIQAEAVMLPGGNPLPVTFWAEDTSVFLPWVDWYSDTLEGTTVEPGEFVYTVTLSRVMQLANPCWLTEDGFTGTAPVLKHSRRYRDRRF